MDEDRHFQQRSIHLEQGDFILFYTDGVIEASNPHGEEFGLERLKQFMLDERSASVSEMLDTLQKTLNSFIGIASQFDDITALVVKRAETQRLLKPALVS